MLRRPQSVAGGVEGCGGERICVDVSGTLQPTDGKIKGVNYCMGCLLDRLRRCIRRSGALDRQTDPHAGRRSCLERRRGRKRCRAEDFAGWRPAWECCILQDAWEVDSLDLDRTGNVDVGELEGIEERALGALAAAQALRLAVFP